MRSYVDFWRKCLDFKGKTNRRDYWVSGILFGFFAFVINITESLILVMKLDWPVELAGRGPVYMVYATFGLLAFISMSARRLRDGGFLDKSAWKFFIPILGYARLIWCLFHEKSASENNRA